jgi:hypothetical protein
MEDERCLVVIPGNRILVVDASRYDRHNRALPLHDVDLGFENSLKTSYCFSRQILRKQCHFNFVCAFRKRRTCFRLLGWEKGHSIFCEQRKTDLGPDPNVSRYRSANVLNLGLASDSSRPIYEVEEAWFASKKLYPGALRSLQLLLHDTDLLLRGISLPLDLLKRP